MENISASQHAGREAAVSKGGGLQEEDPGSLLTYWATHNYEELPCRLTRMLRHPHRRRPAVTPQSPQAAVSPATLRFPDVCRAGIPSAGPCATCSLPALTRPSSPRYPTRRRQPPGAWYQFPAAEGRNRRPSQP